MNPSTLDHPSFHTTLYQPVQLARYIDRLVVFHFEKDTPVQFLPEGQFDLILQSDRDILYQSDHTDGWVPRPKLFVGGLHSRAYTIRPIQKGTRLISIQFKPNCAKYFIPDKLHLYKNQIIDLEDVFPKKQLGQLGAVDTSGEFPTTIRKLEAFLISIFRERASSPVDEGVGLLQQNGFVRIEQIALKAGISPSQFRKRFREEIGMSPKEYSKIVRIKTIIQHLNSYRSTGKLTDLAYQLGYFDQSHLIKDFQSVIGTSPKRFVTTKAFALGYPTQG